MREGVGETPLLLGEWPLGVQEEGEGFSVPSGLTALNRNTNNLASQKISTHTRIHKLLLSFNPDSSYTHTPPWCQCTPWSRFLDDVVKQLHGLHDVLILFA